MVTDRGVRLDSLIHEKVLGGFAAKKKILPLIDFVVTIRKRVSASRPKKEKSNASSSISVVALVGRGRASPG
jgi:hypothetical protein